MPDLYSNETQDFKITKGDTVNIGFNLIDNDGNAVDITAFGSFKFNVLHPVTRQVITALYKYHDDAVTNGKGVYINGDTQLPAGLEIAVNQLVVILTYEDTSLLEVGVYPFDIQITPQVGYTKLASITGNLIVEPEVTPSV